MLYNNGCVSLNHKPGRPTLDHTKVINTSTLRVNLAPDNYHQDGASDNDDDYTIHFKNQNSMKSTWLDLFVHFGPRIFGKDAKPGELGILGVVL